MITNDIESIVNRIIEETSKKRLAIFAGAGISYNSGLPLAKDLEWSTLHSLSGTNEMVKKYIKENKEEIDSLLSSIVPETFFEIFARFIGKGILKILEPLKSGKHNRNHALIAGLIEAGHIQHVITTNFDLLIENALKEEYGMSLNKDFLVWSKEEDFKKGAIIRNQKPIIHKIHGTINDPDSIITTLAQVGKGLSPNKYEVFKKLLAQNTILVIGWRNSDIEITPHFTQQMPKVTWIYHSLESSLNISDEILSIIKINPGSVILPCNTDDLIELLWKKLDLPEKNFTAISPGSKAHHFDWINSLSEGDVLSIMAEILEHFNKFDDSIHFYNKAAEYYFINNKARYYQTKLNTGRVIAYKINWQASLSTHLKVLEEAQQYPEILAKTSTNIGSTYYELGEWQKARQYYEKSLKIANKNNDKYEESQAFNGIGLCQYSTGSWEAALKTFQKALKIKNEIGDVRGQSQIANNLAMLFSAMEKFPEAIEYYNNSIKLKEMIGDTQEVAASLNNLGNVYQKQNRYEKALEKYDAAISFFTRLNDDHGMAHVLNGKALTLTKMGEQSKAIPLFRKSLEMTNQIDDKQLKAQILHNLGLAHTKAYKGQPGEYKIYFEESIKLKTAIKDVMGAALSYLELGFALLEEHQFNKSLHYFLLAKEILGDKKYTPLKARVTSGLTKIYNQLEMYDALKELEEEGDGQGCDALPAKSSV